MNRAGERSTVKEAIKPGSASLKADASTLPECILESYDCYIVDTYRVTVRLLGVKCGRHGHISRDCQTIGT